MNFDILIAVFLPFAICYDDNETLVSLSSRGRSGGQVKAEDLMENALEEILRPGGAFFVNVEEKNRPGMFKIAVCYPKGSSEDGNSKELLQKALTTLGFPDAKITPGIQNIYKRYFDGNIDTYKVNLDPSTMVAQMESFADETFRNTDLSLEDPY